MKILRESMTKCQTVMPNFVVRVWREESIDAVVDHESLILEIKVLAQKNDTEVSLAKKILSLPNMNAVEVLKHCGEGTVLYANWP